METDDRPPPYFELWPAINKDTVFCCPPPFKTILKALLRLPTPYLDRNFYGHKMEALRWAWKLAQTNNQHPWQLKISKSWEPFWSYQLTSLAKPADSPHLFGELAGLAGLFGW